MWLRENGSEVKSVFVYDLDNDGIPEIITGGYTSEIIEGELEVSVAQLRIWHWDGVHLNLLAEKTWYDHRHCYISHVEVGDATGDGIPDIVTGGGSKIFGVIAAQITIWDYTGGALSQIGKKEFHVNPGGIDWDEDAIVCQLKICDPDKDNVQEIVCTGISKGPPPPGWSGNAPWGYIAIWHYANGQIIKENITSWLNDTQTVVFGIDVEDVDEDGTFEIVLGGYTREDKSILDIALHGKIWIWNYNGAELTLEYEIDWINASGLPYYGPMVNSVKIADVDADSIKEILSFGNRIHKNINEIQLRIWNYNGVSASLEKEELWKGVGNADNKGSYVTVGEVDGTPSLEIITGGSIDDGTRPNADLRVWSYDGTNLILDCNREWYTDYNTSINSVFVYDADSDTTPEIITGGYAKINDDITRAQLTIWSPEGVVVVPEHVFSLSKGWNLITLPLQNSTYARAGDLVNGIGSNCTHIARWNTSKQAFDLFWIGAPGINNFTLEAGVGYNVYVTADTNFKLTGTKISTAAPSLMKDWNLLGWYNDTSTDAKTLAQSKGYSSLAYWNNTKQRFVTYIRSTDIGNFVVKKGKGYFVWQD